jgi:hypothetical protein
VIAHPQILKYVRHVLGPDIKLSSLNARSVNPGGAAQPLHAENSRRMYPTWREPS